ncbi:MULTISPECIES: hypothetical protein [unclassified Lentimonas]|uniref:hypothetical protein n=1 Tax=unclassified Lentimonas TaxID=2630993 RepID=UPI0013206542|nr:MULTISPECIES: hypothetical protein [unclassified Lentimonas]CAA6678417.1 Unannotated [Lentimonas sp. CC4]CAA6685509.1 Unannotated [Lentimonas sp. CC6]CAA7076957.1 Unannotated [Lentimonas sp. CC4]CAA7170508.1 Unannotated [Lentimonas sp. CC21]CAA7179795.1 Unannotated [Lentimonas sp. CC8]
MHSSVQKLLTRLCYLLIVALVFSYTRKDQLPDYTSIDQRLLQAPLQQSIAASPFNIDFKGRSYQVRPRASYELHGLIVSHNNPQGIGDIYHDSTSIDTKDLCVIWGLNVRSNAFNKVRYWSNAWTCYCQWNENGLRFSPSLLSNNHLITDNDAIRRKISNVGIGDQIKIKGMLVDYQEIGSQGGWRNSSLTRSDSGNGACEVVFVKELKVLRSTNRIWRKGFQVALILLAATLCIKFTLFWFFDTTK